MAGTCIDAGVTAAMLPRLAGAPDDPTTLAFPEGEQRRGLALPRRAPA